jgi:hypothetical protein
LTDTSTLNEFEGELLFNDIFSSSRFQSRLVAGRFIVNTAASFLRDTHWVRVEKLKSDDAEEVQKIVENEKEKNYTANRMSSIV